MDKTSKLKSRILGLSSRGQKITALCQKQYENDKNMQTDSRSILKGEHKISKNSDCKHNSLNEDEKINQQEHILNRNSEMITPVKTQKLPSSQDAPETPNKSPDAKESPVLQSNLARTFGSPEIEISWDYSCSQVPKGSVTPIIRNKQRRWCFPINLPPLLHLQPYLVPSRGMSEEERREKIASLKGFREELMSNAGSTSHLSTKNHEDDETEEKLSDPVVTDSLVFSKTIQDQRENQIHSLAKQYEFLENTQPVEGEDFECSPEISSRHLYMYPKSDNLNNSRSLPEISSKISTTALFPSLSCAKANLFPENSYIEMDNNNHMNLKLGVCRSKTIDPTCIHLMNHNNKTNFHLQHNSAQNKGNVINSKFEEEITVEKNESLKHLTDLKNNASLNVETRIKTSKEKKDDIYSLLDDSIDEIMVKCSQDVEEELFSQESRNSNVEHEANSKKHVASPLIKCSKAIKTNHKNTVHMQSYNTSDKFDKISTNLNSFTNKEKIVAGTKANHVNINTAGKVNIPNIKGVNILPTFSSSRQKQSQRIAPGVPKVANSDFSALLNDDDACLTSIDFSIIDTACANHKSAASLGNQSTTVTQLKIYTQHEIEAKRIEALKKLRRKRGKT